MVPPFYPRRMQYPGAQQVPKWEHQAAPLVLVLKVLLQEAFVWWFNLCNQHPVPSWEYSPCTAVRKNHHPCVYIPPSRPSETTRQQGSKLVSIG